MDKQWKEDWVEALRSGEFKQGDSCLEDPKTGAHCCLGVLCDIADLPYYDREYNSFHERGEERWYFDDEVRRDLSQKEDEEDDIYPGNHGGSTGFLPDLFADEVGITREQQEVLTNLNDEEDATFDEIADYIEAYL